MNVSLVGVASVEALRREPYVRLARRVKAKTLQLLGLNNPGDVAEAGSACACSRGRSALHAHK